jgi:hypothetical protein
MAGLALLVLSGLALRRADPAGRLDAWLCRPEAERPRAKWDVVVPGPVLGLVSLAGLVVFSVVALFIYYPPPDQVLEEIGRVRAEAASAVRSGNRLEGVRQMEQWDLLTRKLQVGVFLRTGRLDPGAAKLAEDLRERLEEVRDALLADDVAEAKNLLPAVETAHRRCREAFQPTAAAGSPAPAG